MNTETIARRYATALADVLSQNGDRATAQAELKTWAEMITGNTDLNTAFANPSIAHAQKEKVLGSLIDKVKPGKTTSNFLRVLLQNDRLLNLSEINETLSKVLDERAGLITATVVSARELTEAEKKDLETNIEKMSGKDVSIDFQIDQTLIGGVVTTIGSTVYDGSVKTQLENLKQQLVNG